MDDRDLRLDGNAVAGMLGEIFTDELTTDAAACDACGAANQVGALMAYVHGMGAVLRCTRCEAVVLRVGRAPDRLWLDLRGARWLQVRVGP
jgi:Family of unknown function (DUF6510)